MDMEFGCIVDNTMGWNNLKGEEKMHEGPTIYSIFICPL